MESEEKRERKVFRRHKNKMKKQIAALIREQATAAKSVVRKKILGIKTEVIFGKEDDIQR